MEIKYNISEIFKSLQGEGRYIGMPCIFIRFSGCNLRCEWDGHRCDTPYASFQAEKNMVTIKYIIRKIKKLNEACNIKNIVLTGGEPALYNLDPLCERLKEKKYKIHIETNGTRPITKLADVVVCSPKLSDSIPKDTTLRKMHSDRVNIFDNLQDIIEQKKEVYLKFVITKKTRIYEILNIVAKLNIDPENIYFMPEGINKDELMANSQYITDMALLLGINFTPRLHIMLWGNKRGA